MITIEILAFFDIILLLKKSLSNILNDFFFFKYLQNINQDVSQIVSFEQLGRVPNCSFEQLGTRPNCPQILSKFGIRF